MDKTLQQLHQQDHQTSVLQAAVLMQRAIDLLDRAGELRAAVHLQHAIDTLATRLHPIGQPH